VDRVLTIRGLSKSFGHIRAVDSIDLEVEKGQVLGMLGPNGSGKTTTLSVILGVKIADSGTFEWFEGIRGSEANRRIGAILEVPYFFSYLNLTQNLQIVAKVRGKGINQIESVLKTVGLETRAKSAYYTLSLGMKQRLALASALLGNPEVLVLDEPTNGLDPEGIAEVREIIKEQARQGKTIIIASHILDEVEKVCSHVAILKNGKKIAYGKVNELLAEKQRVTISADNLDQLVGLLYINHHLKIAEKQNDKVLVTLEEGYSTAEMNKWLSENGVVLNLLEIHKKTLEDQFLELVKNPQ
jgi:ABC-2 type transport system ATP-binding protein